MAWPSKDVATYDRFALKPARVRRHRIRRSAPYVLLGVLWTAWDFVPLPGMPPVGIGIVLALGYVAIGAAAGRLLAVRPSALAIGGATVLQLLLYLVAFTNPWYFVAVTVAAALLSLVGLGVARAASGARRDPPGRAV